jgi:integrase
MASVYKQRKYRPIPDNAEIVRRRGGKIARWVDGRGTRQEAPLSEDGIQIVLESGPYWGKYRDHNGVVKRRSTGCRDRQSAEKKLQDWLTEADRLDSCLITTAQIDAKQHAKRPIKDHRQNYKEHLKYKTVRGRRVSPDHVKNVNRVLKRLITECKFTRLGDINRDAVTRWMNRQEDEGDMSGRTINTYRSAIVAFCRWAVREGRLINSPLEGLDTADESETKRNRRALNEIEVGRLLASVRARPLRDAMMIRTGPRKGQLGAKLKPSMRKRLIEVGDKRYLIDLVMLYTGLRRIEVERLIVSDLHLNAVVPFVALKRSTTKNARESKMPLRKDLVPLLLDWIAHKLPGTNLFDIPRNYVKVLDLDLEFAGIPKEDGKKRTIDVHSLRHTFASELERAGISPQMIKRLMRHSGDVTDRYLHTSLREVSDAIEKLPDYFRLSESQANWATGTDDIVAQNGDLKSMPISMPKYAQKYAQNQSLPDNACQDKTDSSDFAGLVSGENKEACQCLTSPVEKRPMRFELTTSSLGSWHSTTELRPL